MSQPSGFYLPLSLPRRLMGDLLHFASRVPSVPVERRMNLAPLVAVRDRAVPKPGWCSIFTKAWAFACAVHPPLRRAYLTFPWAKLYQHPINVATIAVERPYGDEDAIFFTHITQPEQKPLLEIDKRLKWFKDRPLERGCAALWRQMQLSSLPRPLRRLVWWSTLNLSGRQRARFLGTFAVTAYSALGASSLHPRGLLTTTLNYGVIEQDGSVDVRIIYDHRTLDGGTVARALADMERFLLHEIVAELRYLEGLEAA
jgi:hypothetical protein